MNYLTFSCAFRMEHTRKNTRDDTFLFNFELVPNRHFFSIAPRSRDSLNTHLLKHFLKNRELALASVNTCFSARRLFDPIKKSSLVVNSRDTKHGFCSRLVWPFVECKGKTERLLFSSRIF